MNVNFEEIHPCAFDVLGSQSQTLHIRVQAILTHRYILIYSTFRFREPKKEAAIVDHTLLSFTFLYLYCEWEKTEHTPKLDTPPPPALWVHCRENASESLWWPLTHTPHTRISFSHFWRLFSSLYFYKSACGSRHGRKFEKKRQKLPPSAKKYKCCLSFAPASLSFLLPSTLFFGSYLSFFVPLRDRSSLHCSAGTSESKLTGSRERRCVCAFFVFLCVCVSGWGSHASSELIPVIRAIMRCTRRSLPARPPASVTNCHHPGGQTRTLSRTLTHWWDSSPSPHTCSCRHTHSYSPGKERRKEGRKNKKDFTSLIASSLCGADFGRWTEETSPPLVRAHTPLPPQPRTLGLVCPGVECGSGGADQHGEPSREAGGNGVRSASCIVVCLSITSLCFVCLLS